MNTISAVPRTEKMSNAGFKIMSWMFRISDIFSDKGEKLNSFGIKSGFVVVDWGCGPGRYIRKASELVSQEGLVYAVDIHELAIRSVERLIEKSGLQNVIPLQTDGRSVEINDDSADMIYALDMFHMVRDPNEFLRELNRITKKNGILIIEDGHQSRAKAKQKILLSDDWSIIEENRNYLKCRPIKVALKYDSINLL